MGMQYGQSPSVETTGTPQGPQQAPADLEVGGLEAWGNAAVAEQYGSTGSAEIGVPSGEVGAEGPAWAAPLEGDVEAAGGGLAPIGVFNAEIAKPNPDPAVVYRALREMTPTTRARVYENRQVWAIVERILPIEQRAELVPQIHGEREQFAKADPGIQEAIREVQTRLEEQILDVIGIELDEMFADLSEVEPGPRYIPVGMQETKFTEFGPDAARMFGRPGATVRLGTQSICLTVKPEDGMVPSVTASVGDSVHVMVMVDHPVFGPVTWREGYEVPSFTARELGIRIGGPSRVTWKGPLR